MTEPTQNNRPFRNPLGYQPIEKLLMRFALPAVISMLVNALYNIVDQVFIGIKMDYIGNAATTVAFPVMSVMLAISTLLGAGGSAYAAIKLGEKKEKDAERTLGTVFTLLTVIGILITIFGLIYLDPILRLCGASDTVMPYAREYTAIILLGAPFNMLGVGLSNMARTDGNPSLSMYSMIAGAAINTVLDPIYIFVFHWDMAGAAIATISSQIISTVILIVYFLRRGKRPGHMLLRPRDLLPDPFISARVTVLGISSCITQISSTVLQIVMNNSLMYYGDLCDVTGDVALSAVGIVLKVSMILISVNIGIGIGSQPILGFNRGANQPERIRKTYISAVGMASVVSVAGWLACLLLPQYILKIFGAKDPTFIRFAIKSMQIFMAGILVSGFQIVTTSYFQATGQPFKASVLSMLRQLIFLIPLILILPLWWGLDGILYAGPIADFAAAAVVALFVIHEMRRLSKWIQSNQEEAQNQEEARNQEEAQTETV